MSDDDRTITLYGIPNCDTVKKARTWLDAHALSHAFHNFKKDGVTPVMIQSWLKDNDWEALLNRKGTTWRALADARKACIIDVSSAIALMCESPSVIKRPILTIGNATALPSPASRRGERSESLPDFRVNVGFSDALYQQIFKK